MIKSPADLVLGAAHTLECRANQRSAVQLMADLGQNLLEPPTVKGWEGGRQWINSASLLQRNNFAAELALGDQLGPIADPAAIADKQQWRDAQAMIAYYAELLLASDAAANMPALERALQETQGTLSRRLRGVIHVVLTMPEYQLV
jgi:uncharacterized protein (DUF1800 family)